MRRGDTRRSISILEGLWLSPLLLGYVAYGLLSARHGLPLDPDARAIWRSAEFLLQGRYVPSRTSGFPAYDTDSSCFVRPPVEASVGTDNVRLVGEGGASSVEAA